MINAKLSKNTNWEIGAIVNIGFLKGFIVKAVRAEYDFLPDIYTLERNGKTYEFIPHNGLRAI